MTKNKILLIASIFVCSIVFTIPFIMKGKSDSWMSVLGTAYTSLGAIATFMTLLIAIFLYKKLSLDNKFLENQTLKVLELADFLKGKNFNIQTEVLTYFLRFNIDDPILKNEPFYEQMKSKIIVIDFGDFGLFSDNLLEIKRSYWLPKEIKEKLEFLEFAAITEITDLEKSSIAKLYLKNENGHFGLTLPRMTVDELINNKNALVEEIYKWINKHSEIKIDLKLEEPERHAIDNNSKNETT